MTFAQWARITICPACSGRGWIVVGSLRPVRECAMCSGAGRDVTPDAWGSPRLPQVPVTTAY